MRDSKLPKSPLAQTLKWVGAFSALGFLVGIGIWVGTIQYMVDQNTEDIHECEEAHRTNLAKIAAADGVERDRLNKLRDSVVIQLNSDKDELWELKRAMAAINTRVALYHERSHSYGPPAVYGTESVPPSTKSVPMATKRKIAAEQADELVQDVMESPEESPPMPTF